MRREIRTVGSAPRQIDSDGSRVHLPLDEGVGGMSSLNGQCVLTKSPRPPFSKGEVLSRRYAFSKVPALGMGVAAALIMACSKPADPSASTQTQTSDTATPATEIKVAPSETADSVGPPSDTPTSDDTAQKHDSEFPKTDDSDESDETVSNDSKNGSETDGPSDTTPASSESDSSVSVASDTGPDTEIVYTETELLYDFPQLEGEGGDIFALGVDNIHVYFATMSALGRADKNGGGEVEMLGGGVTGARHQNLALGENYAYWKNGLNVVKMDKATLEQTLLPFAEEGEDMEIHVLTIDDDRIYLAGPGCLKIISLSKTGDQRVVSVRTDEVLSALSTTVLTTDATHVYCATGRGDSKIVRCPKEGGEVTEVAILPERLDEEVAWLQPQVIGMSVVEDKIYILSSFKDGGLSAYFGYAPAAGGDYTRLHDLMYVTNIRLLFHDALRGVLYFLTSGENGYKGFYKYTLDTQIMSYTPIFENGAPPMAMDDDYLYFRTRSQIRRLKKF